MVVDVGCAGGLRLSGTVEDTQQTICRAGARGKHYGQVGKVPPSPFRFATLYAYLITRLSHRYFRGVFKQLAMLADLYSAHTAREMILNCITAVCWLYRHAIHAGKTFLCQRCKL